MISVNSYLTYFLQVTAEEDGAGYVGQLSEAPGMIVCGDSIEELIQNARIGILDLAAGYFEVKKPFPPALEQKGTPVSLGYDAALKIAARNLLIAKKMSCSDLALDMNISRQLLSRRLNLYKSTSLETLGAIFEALGARLELRLQPGS